MSKIAVGATEIVNELFRAIDARDAAAVAELLTDDAAMADEMSKGWVRGKAQIQEFVATSFAAEGNWLISVMQSSPLADD